MSAMLATLTRPAAAFSRRIDAFLDRIVHHFVKRAAMAHLNGLEDWALHDIGIGRSEIEAAVRGTLGASRA